MSEIAEMMLDGTLCEGCGKFIGENAGYPTYCSAQCAGDRDAGLEQIAGGPPQNGEVKSIRRKRQRDRRKENYRDMQSLLQKTADMIDNLQKGGSLFSPTDWNNHNQAIKARLKRVK